ncbi:hypothetical protein BDN72DRAFT_816650 [Pluteus cervinus]|uniref:Uncharacterized protein n=1 Tax=Pluteus cervinus TaxID=181527 RepID=A0ACD3B2I3_9AGAR|nr:hypothetical protein BDN72DRAFT_816650 [Pluteus cervinus]
MAPFYPSRSASLAIALFGVATNVIFATQILAAWQSIKWEPETEWEASVGSWSISGIKLIWILIFSYFAFAASVCAVGFFGIANNKPSCVRFYRDYSIADFSFCTFFTILTTYGLSGTSIRAGVCEELSHHPELVRDVAEMGLSLENCEQWMENSVLMVVAALVVLIVIRLHFLISVTNYYSSLVRSQRASNEPPLYGDIPSKPQVQARFMNTEHGQRVLLLPRSPYHLSNSSEDMNEPVVYAPIPLSSLPAEIAQDLRETATEAWVSHLEPTPSCEHRQHRQHRHHHGHRSRRSTSANSLHHSGAIALPINPGEGLLTGNREVFSEEVKV